jgi:serine/threonine-protein kinase HipA
MAQTATVTIAVYADWDGLPGPMRLGFLYAHRVRGRDVFEFEFDREVLRSVNLGNARLDARLEMTEGHQHPQQGANIFGLFADSSPDRWGRVLMQRRLEREQREGRQDPTARLTETDYLLGVHDEYRVGALRFKLNDEGGFLDNQDGIAAPPFVQLRELQEAVRDFERSEDGEAGREEWLRLLIAPGGSLGGARPKASVVDPNGGMWIAKFPSGRDGHDVGAWELIVNTLAGNCGIQVPEGMIKKFANSNHTFLIKRFDRRERRRLHFASAMTLTGRVDGDDASVGASYLELARVLIDQGAQPAEDLQELWTRIVFNILVSNTDDHLRNHGFILSPGSGWRLSDAYDMNPVPGSNGLKLNISEHDNALDLDLTRSVAPYFRVSAVDANDIIERCKSVVVQWSKIATGLHLSKREQDQMADAFRLAN